MNKLWLVAWYEYRRNVLRKSFVILLLSVPLIIALSVGLGALISSLENNKNALGYVDLAGFLASDPLPAPQPGESPDSVGGGAHVPLVAFSSEAGARAALEAGDIQAYYVISEDYAESNRVELVYIKLPGDNATRQFWDFMQINRLTDLPVEVARRAVAGSNMVVRWPDSVPGGGREFSEQAFINTLAPLFIGLASIILFFTNAGYLAHAVSGEKENRMIEILATSISPGQLIGGKVVGIVGIALTQVLCWTSFAALAVWIGARFLGVTVLQRIDIDPRIVAQMVLLGLPMYVMAAGVMVTLASALSASSDASQLGGLLIQPVMIPFYLAQHIMERPDSALTIGLSLFPATALSTYSFRLTFTPVPLWQVGASAGILVLCALGSLWLAGRAFRLGMLRYGKRLRFKEILGGR
jgi:ABC-2 type transport system permease protein